MKVLVTIAGSGTGKYPLMGVVKAMVKAVEFIDSYDTDAANLAQALGERGIKAEHFEEEGAGIGVIIMREGGGVA